MMKIWNTVFGIMSIIIYNTKYIYIVIIMQHNIMCPVRGRPYGLYGVSVILRRRGKTLDSRCIANILYRSAPPRVWNSIITLRPPYRVSLTWTLFTVIFTYLGASTVAEEEDDDDDDVRRFRVCIFFVLSGVL